MKLELLEENKTLGPSILTIIQFKVSVLHIVPNWAMTSDGNTGKFRRDCVLWPWKQQLVQQIDNGK